MKSKIILTLVLLLFFGQIKAQNIDDLLNETTKDKTLYSTAAFKSTRIINGHSIEQLK